MSKKRSQSRRHALQAIYQWQIAGQDLSDISNQFLEEQDINKFEIPYHIEPIPGRSGTDAWGIQVSREGIPTGLVALPSRYMHQPVETVAVKDVERTGRLLAAFAAGLEADYRPRWEDEAA